MSQKLDIAGIGSAPANLSLAALLMPLPEVDAAFFERRPCFDWHPGMMLPGADLQTSYLKDLVTPTDPTNPLSFLAYLVQKGRFYRFLNADFPTVKRAEFADYLRWAAEQVPSLTFNSEVQAVDFDDDGFRLSFTDRPDVHAEHIVVATGPVPHVPHWAQPHVGSQCVHAHSYLREVPSVAGRNVTVIGGGQSGAEIFLDILGGNRGQPASVDWITRRPNLEPLDETAFTNEFFTPEYVRQFHGIDPARKQELVAMQKLAGDGVSPDTLIELSRTLYERDFVEPGEATYRILAHREVQAMRRLDGRFHLQSENLFNGESEESQADIVILATGYRHAPPPCLNPLAPRLERDSLGQPVLHQDYTVGWDGPARHRIYMQNAGRHTHSVADAQLSLASWRAAVIINSVLEREIYPTAFCPPPVQWGGDGTAETQAGSVSSRRLAQ